MEATKELESKLQLEVRQFKEDKINNTSSQNKEKEVELDEKIAELKRQISKIPCYKYVLATETTINYVIHKIIDNKIKYFNKIDSEMKLIE